MMRARRIVNTFLSLERASKPRNPRNLSNHLRSSGKKFKGSLRIEKEKTKELLNVRDEMLKQKEEELENWGREREKLQLELKKLQKLMEFKPTMNFPLIQSLREMKQEKNVKSKKKAGLDIKKLSPTYILWCKDRWNEVKKENLDAEFKEISNILGSKWKNVSP